MNEVLFILIITGCNNYLSVFLGYKARYTWIFVSRHPFVFINNGQKTEGPTTQWPKEEGPTTQWPKEE
jgi:hypothetical protein